MDKPETDLSALEQMNSLLMVGSSTIEDSRIGEPFPSVAACLMKFAQDCEQLPKEKNERRT